MNTSEAAARFKKEKSLYIDGFLVKECVLTMDKTLNVVYANGTMATFTEGTDVKATSNGIIACFQRLNRK